MLYHPKLVVARFFFSSIDYEGDSMQTKESLCKIRSSMFRDFSQLQKQWLYVWDVSLIHIPNLCNLHETWVMNLGLHKYDPNCQFYKVEI